MATGLHETVLQGPVGQRRIRQFEVIQLFQFQFRLSITENGPPTCRATGLTCLVEADEAVAIRTGQSRAGLPGEQHFVCCMSLLLRRNALQKGVENESST